MRSALLLPLAAALSGAIPASAEISPQPNIVLIVADDLGWSDPGFRGGPIETPTLDALATEGLEFERFYTTPICSPTRAALHTGRAPMRLGIAYNTIMAWHNNGVHPDERFMPEASRDAGYQTAMAGKWHLGHAQQTYHPNARGYEYFYGHLHTEVGYFPPFAVQGGKDFQRNGESIASEGFETFILAKEASRYIRERDVGGGFLDFPRIYECMTGRKNRFGYASGFATDYGASPLFDRIVQFDRNDESVQSIELGEGTYTQEFVFAPRIDSQSEDNGDVIGLIRDEPNARPECSILDARRFADGPVARIHIPERVPYGFHSHWVDSFRRSPL